MAWIDDIKIVRRYLRDPDGNIWSDAFLRHLWNDVQQDLQHNTSVLEDVIAQRIPDLYHQSYMHDWEYRHVDSNLSEFYQCLRKHDDKVFCHSWEPQIVTGITSDVSDVGCHFTQPWEAFMGLTPGEEIKMKFPKNFRDVKFIAYDEEPISATTRKMVQSADTSYIETDGTPIAYYINEGLDKTYTLYPRPSTAFIDEVIGDGIAFFAEGDTDSADYGVIAIRTGSSETSNVGASVDVVSVTNNILLIYDVSPTDITSFVDESDFPEFLRKYVRYGVLARAYMANTDGKIPSLARLWGDRYQLGIQVVRRFLRNRREDRDYRLTTQGITGRRRRRVPRLPSTYPAV